MSGFHGLLFLWQNAIHLPFDIWLNVDAQLMTSSWDNNMKLSNTPWYVNAKLCKGYRGTGAGNSEKSRF